MFANFIWLCGGTCLLSFSIYTYFTPDKLHLCGVEGEVRRLLTRSIHTSNKHLLLIRTVVHKVAPLHRKIAPHQLVEAPASLNRVGNHLPLRFLNSIKIVLGLTSSACPTIRLPTWNVLHENELYYDFIVRWICQNCQNNRASIWMQPTGSQPANETTTNWR